MALNDAPVPDPAPRLPLTEDGARVVAVRAGCGGGYTPSRVPGGWLFTPTFSLGMPSGNMPWIVSDNGTAQPFPLDGRSVAEVLSSMN